jgi:Uncharacterized alpha/beta hydrolase domain (DUF2235)
LTIGLKLALGTSGRERDRQVAHRQGEPEQFEQIWFAGNHADIGGSCSLENELRLPAQALGERRPANIPPTTTFAKNLIVRDKALSAPNTLLRWTRAEF